jgi:hypothetical protein
MLKVCHYWLPSLFLRFTFLLLISVGSAHAMRFSIQSICPGEDCETVIIASGQIDAQSTKALQSLLNTHSSRPKTIEMNSTQGDFLAAMQLGQFIRAQKLNTRVRYSVTPNLINTSQNFIPAKCHSACLLAFMGGIQRSIDPRAEIGLNNVSSQGRELIQRYVKSMGVDPSIWDLASAPQKTSYMTWQQSQSYGLDNRRHNALRPWQLRQTKNGLLLIASNELSDNVGRVTMALSKVTSEWRLIVHLNLENTVLQSELIKNPSLKYSIKESNQSTLLPIKNWFEVKGGIQLWLPLTGMQLSDWVQNKEMNLWIRSDSNLLIQIVMSNSQLKDLIVNLP